VCCKSSGSVNFNLQAKTDVCSVSMAESTELFQALLYWKLATSDIIDSNVDAAVPAMD